MHSNTTITENKSYFTKTKVVFMTTKTNNDNQTSNYDLAKLLGPA